MTQQKPATDHPFTPDEDTSPAAASGRAPTPARVGRRALLGGALGTLIAAGGTSAWALNHYVIDHVEVTNASAQTAQALDVVAASSTGAATGTSYSSDTAQISISRKTIGSGDDLITYFVADVLITDATILRSAFADDSFGENIIANPSTIAKQAAAVLAINGDYYGFRDTGIVIRNGVKYRDSGARQGLAFYADGTMKLYDETTTNADTLLAEGVWQTWSFGPGIVEDRKLLSGIDSVEVDTNFGNHSIQGQQPRTGIGFVEANHLLFVAVDGRSAGYSRGVTMSEFGQIFVDAGAHVAYNLDGGGSTTMVFNDTLVNNPLGRGAERGTSDIIYIAG